MGPWAMAPKDFRVKPSLLISCSTGVRYYLIACDSHKPRIRLGTWQPFLAQANEKAQGCPAHQKKEEAAGPAQGAHVQLANTTTNKISICFIQPHTPISRTAATFGYEKEVQFTMSLLSGQLHRPVQN